MKFFTEFFSLKMQQNERVLHEKIQTSYFLNHPTVDDVTKHRTSSKLPQN